MKRLYIVLLASAFGFHMSINAQDVNERAYLYPMLTPKSNSGNIIRKPKVEGFAYNRDEKVSEKLNTDADNVAFNVYRSENGGKFAKINSKPVSATTDYIDNRASTMVSYYLGVAPEDAHKYEPLIEEWE